MIKSFIKHYWPAIVLAVFYGVLMILPFVYFISKLGPDFQGIFPEIVNDENFYYARINDVIDGHPFLSNAYLAEHKKGLPQQVFLVEWLLAQPIKLFNINIQTGHLIYNFLLPAISLLLTYAAFYLVLRRRFWSLIFSSFLFFGLYPLVFIRPVSPQFNFIFWLTQFIFLWLLIDNRGSTRIGADQRGKKAELLYEDITYKIRGACFKVWKEFRGGFNEKLIERALVTELKNVGLEVENQKREDIFYYNQKIGMQIFDIVVNKLILIELKSLPFLTNGNRRQFWTYLKKSSYRLGLLINFGNKLQIERKIFDQARNQELINKDKTQINADSFPRISATYLRISAILLLNILNFGLLFYIYPYYWTFYLIFFAIFATLNLANSKHFHNSNYGSKEILQVILGGLVLAIPYFYFNYLVSQLPYYTETLMRLGMIYSRFPSGIRIIFWSTLSFAAFGWFLISTTSRRSSDNGRIDFRGFNVKSLFFISGILASVVAVNQHLITGRNLEFTHYDMGAMFFLVFAISYLLSERELIFRRTFDVPGINGNLRTSDVHSLLRILLLIVVLAVVVNGLYGYSKQAFVIDKENVYRQNYAPIFNWLNKNTEKDSVVFANEDLSRLIPVYTSNNIFYVREANLFFISDEEVLDRFILNNFFEKFNQDFMTENVRSIYGVRYIDAYGHTVQGNKLRRLLGLKTEPEVYLPDKAIKKVVDRAEKLQRGDWIGELKKYRIDYLIWDKNKNPNWRISEKFFKPIFKDKNITVYTANFD